MTWLIFALGAGMAVAGVVSVLSGYQYTSVEWGWTEVIAGATVFSGGAVVVALAGVVLRLGALKRVIERGGLATSMPPPPPVLQYRLPLEEGNQPMAERPQGDPAGAEAQYPAPQDYGLVPRDEAAASAAAPEYAPFVAPSGEEAADLALGEPPPLPDSVTEPPQRRKSMFAGLRDRRSRPKDLADSSSQVPTAGPATDRTPEVGFQTFHPDAEPAVADFAPLRRFGEGYDAYDGGAVAAEAGDHAPVPGAPAQGYEASPSAPSDPAAEAQEAPTVVGRYQAGSSSYVLYSNGTIEVESANGVHRFASMRELKAYIDQSA